MLDIPICCISNLDVRSAHVCAIGSSFKSYKGNLLNIDAVTHSNVDSWNNYCSVLNLFILKWQLFPQSINIRANNSDIRCCCAVAVLALQPFDIYTYCIMYIQYMQKMHMYFCLFRLLVIRNHNHKEFTNTICRLFFKFRKMWVGLLEKTQKANTRFHQVFPRFTRKKNRKKTRHPGQNGRGPSFDQHCM